MIATIFWSIASLTFAIISVTCLRLSIGYARGRQWEALLANVLIALMTGLAAGAFAEKALAF